MAEVPDNYKEIVLPNGMTIKIDPETEKEYKRAGEYMMNTVDYTKGRPIVPELSEDDKVFMFAIEGVKAGLDPKELSEQELTVVFQRLGPSWFTQFGYAESEIRQPVLQLVGKPNKTLAERKMVKKYKKALIQEIKKRQLIRK